MTNWLDPGDVREFLNKYDELGGSEPSLSRTIDLAEACSKFVREVAAVLTPDIDHPEWCRCYTCSTKKVARLLVMAMGEK